MALRFGCHLSSCHFEGVFVQKKASIPRHVRRELNPTCCWASGILGRSMFQMERKGERSVKDDTGVPWVPPRFGAGGVLESNT